MATTETLSSLLPTEVEDATRRRLAKAGATRIASMRVAIEMMTDML